MANLFTSNNLENSIKLKEKLLNFIKCLKKVQNNLECIEEELHRVYLINDDSSNLECKIKENKVYIENKIKYIENVIFPNLDFKIMEFRKNIDL